MARIYELPAKLDLDAAAAFLDAVPIGCWTSYGDVAMAAGRTSRAAHRGLNTYVDSKRVADTNGWASDHGAHVVEADTGPHTRGSGGASCE